MGLFSFLKNSGAKVLTKKATTEAVDKETKRLQQELLNRQKLILLKGVVKTTGVKVKNLEMDVTDTKVTVYGQVKDQASKEKLILSIGNVNGIAKVDDRISVVKAAPEAKMHTVKKGETLGKIAKKYYGEAKLYTKIFEANKPMLKNPNRIYPGQVLRIPTV